MRGLLLVILASSVSGCALNAVLEVQMTLPFETREPMDPMEDRAFAVVQVQDAPPIEWHEAWGGTPQVFRIDGAAPDDVCAEVDGECNVRFSVSSDNVDLEHMYVKIRFCHTSGCDGGPPGARDALAPFFGFVIEQPFHRGCVTSWDPSQGLGAIDALRTQPSGGIHDFRDPTSACTCTPTPGADNPDCSRLVRTRWLCPPITTPTHTVERCHVGQFGVEGDGSLGWCRSDGRHFCE